MTFSYEPLLVVFSDNPLFRFAFLGALTACFVGTNILCDNDCITAHTTCLSYCQDLVHEVALCCMFIHAIDVLGVIIIT